MSGNQMPQQYCLRWNNHQHNLLSVFEDLLNHEAFVDVTLACDGLQLKAHKMVLSACSPYFQSLLYNTPDRHPIVFLRDVRYHEMKALLEFMYRGEVSVDQENLSSLLKVAEGLKIKGLAEVNDQAAAAVAMAAESSIKAPQPQVPTSHAGHLSHFGLHGFPGLLSPHALETAVANSLASKLAASSSSVSPPPSIVSALSVGPSFLGPKRKRGRPRRLSGSEAIPMASGLSENGLNQMDVHTEDLSSVEKMEKGMRDGSGDVSPKDTKPNDLLSEADSIDGRTSGLLSPKREASLWSPHDFSRSTGGLHHQLHHQQQQQQQKHHDEGVSEVSCEPDVKSLFSQGSENSFKLKKLPFQENDARKGEKFRSDSLTSTFATLSPISSSRPSPPSTSSRPQSLIIQARTQDSMMQAQLQDSSIQARPQDSKLKETSRPHSSSFQDANRPLRCIISAQPHSSIFSNQPHSSIISIRPQSSLTHSSATSPISNLHQTLIPEASRLTSISSLALPANPTSSSLFTSKSNSITIIDASSQHRTIVLQDATVTALPRPDRLDSKEAMAQRRLPEENLDDISSPTSSESGTCEHGSSLALEYTQNEDGSCTCKICAEVVPSRTHWYRHKYKVHNVSLFRCDKCEIFFKSKKGFGGHIQNRHSPKIIGSDGKPKSKKEVEGLTKVLKELQTKKEAEMVQRIIAKVKAECEASGGDIERRGYTKHY